MQKLSNVKNGYKGTIIDIDGDSRFLSRITSIGLTIGTEIEVITNEKKLPVLVYGRDTLIAINKAESEKIKVRVNN